MSISTGGLALASQDLGTNVVVEEAECGQIETARTVTAEFSWSRNLSFFPLSESAHVEICLTQAETMNAILSCQALAQLVRALRVTEDDRASLEAQAGLALSACVLVRASPLSVEVLESRLEDLVAGLEGLRDILVLALAEATTARNADEIIAATVLADASCDFADGVRYLAGRVRLYGRGALRGECTTLVWRVACGFCAGDAREVLAALTLLRTDLAEACASSFQRSRRDAAVAKIDDLLGDWQERRTGMECGVSGVADLSGVPLDWRADVSREAGTSLAESSTETAWKGTCSTELSGMEIAASVEHRCLTHDDAAAREDDVAECTIETTAAFTMNEADGTIGFAAERKRFPWRFDREVPLLQVASVEGGVVDLKGDVARLVAGAAVRGRLLSPLDKALLALRDGRRADAVAALAQFRDQIWKEAFGATLLESSAEVLSREAENLLPRREESSWDIPATVSGMLGEWDTVADVEWTGRSAPGDSPWERTDWRASLRMERDVAGAALAIDAGAHEVEYLNDAIKGYRDSQLSLGASTSAGSQLQAKTEIGWGSTLYALDPSKDVHSVDRSIDASLSQVPWELTLSVSGSEVAYPNDPDRDKWTIASEIAASAVLAEGRITFSWTSERQESTTGWEKEDSVRVELDVRGEPLGVVVSATATSATCLADGEGCRWRLGWKVGVNAGF